MSTKQISLIRKRVILSLLTFAVGVSLMAIIHADPDISGATKQSANTEVQCRDLADFIAALDRSRNGVSLTCNRHTLTENHSL